MVTLNMAAVLEDRDSEMANDMDEDGYILERILLKELLILLNVDHASFSLIKRIEIVSCLEYSLFFSNGLTDCRSY